MDLDDSPAARGRLRRVRHPPEARPAADGPPRRRRRARSRARQPLTRPTSTPCSARGDGDRAAALRPLPARPAISTSPTPADDLPRFRVNAFRQRGATRFALRVIPKKVPRFDDLGLPPGVRSARRGAPRPRARHRRDRLGQDDDARGDDRLHQPDAASRTSSRSRTRSRSCTPTTSRSSTSARSASTPRASARPSAARSARTRTRS